MILSLTRASSTVINRAINRAREDEIAESRTFIVRSDASTPSPLFLSFFSAVRYSRRSSPVTLTLSLSCNWTSSGL